MEINFLFRIYSIVLPIILGVIAAFFLYIGLRVIITKRPFLVSNKWLLWIMFIVITPNILHDLFLPSSTPILIKWLESAIFTVVLVMSYFTLKGYVAYGIINTSFREALLTTLEKLQLPYEITLFTIRLTSVEADLQVSTQSGRGVQIKVKQRQHHSQLAGIVAAMNEHFQISSSPINLKSCVFIVFMGVIMVIAGVMMVF